MSSHATSRIPAFKPTQTTSDRIEAARLRRLSIASKEEEKRNAVTERKISAQAPPSSFKTPARPVRRSSSATRQGPSEGNVPSRSASATRGLAENGLGRRASVNARSSAAGSTTNSNADIRHTRRASAFANDTSNPSTAKQSHLRQPSPTKNPLSRSASTRTPSSRPRHTESVSTHPDPKDRPAFTTTQQTFTPAKRLPNSTAASLTSPYAQEKPAQSPTIRTLSTLKHQARLLHLLILSEDFDKTYPQWTQSAHDKLEKNFEDLQGTYESSLRTARSTRQHRNLLALWRWCGGNEASLVRRVNTLVSVLDELSALNAGEDAWRSCPEAEARGWTAPVSSDPENENATQGDYTRTIRGFEAWASWVSAVWEARDLVRGVHLHDQDVRASPPVTPLARNKQQQQRTQMQLQDIEIPEEVRELAETHLAPLGDALKASLKSLAAQLGRLAVRLGDLVVTEIPVPLLVDGFGEGEVEGDREGEEIPGVGPVPTPKVLLEGVWSIVQGMQEELQIAREVEFEVTVGERAWWDARVGEIGGNVVAGLG